ncbi:MAG: PhzF family phenazine biosynthesis protein [Rhodospirillales bacterium]|nr:MAG: PhzF family phenazine biosynthesis protein [Rhodospirillales bacterium]
MSLRFKQVDVFTDKPFLGNPVAVVLGADALDTAAMQGVANWTNLSETTFVLKPTTAGADYRVRIFTPGSELPFAGHPTLGTAHAALEAGIVTPRGGRLTQECGVGLVGLSVTEAGGRRSLALDLPPSKSTGLTTAQLDELEACLDAAVERAPAPAVVDVGPKWLVARLKDAASVRALTPDFDRMAVFDAGMGRTGVTVFGAHPPGGPAAIEVRSFAPSCGVREDPVCGSGNGCVAVFARDGGLLSTYGRSYVAAQGGCVGRDGRVRVAVAADGAITLGGDCVTCVDGTIAL